MNTFPEPTRCSRLDAYAPTQQYWSIPPPKRTSKKPSPLSESELNTLRDSLVESIEGRLISDVPLCLFLSAGVDSPLVAALVRNELGIRPQCLTVSFSKGNVVNEAPLARSIADHLGLDFFEITSEDDSTYIGPNGALSLFGQPNDNITAISCYQVSKAAAHHFKVALTGMGGDEVFYGYSKHSFIYTKRKQYALPDSIKKCWSTIKNGVRTRKDLSTFDALINVKPYEVYPAIKNSHCLEWIRSVPGYKSWVQNEFENSEAPEHFVPRYELSTVIQNSHLPAFDHGSMRAGFELRTPFLSRSLVSRP